MKLKNGTSDFKKEASFSFRHMTERVKFGFRLVAMTMNKSSSPERVFVIHLNAPDFFFF